VHPRDSTPSKSDVHPNPAAFLETRLLCAPPDRRFLAGAVLLSLAAAALWAQQQPVFRADTRLVVLPHLGGGQERPPCHQPGAGCLHGLRRRCTAAGFVAKFLEEAIRVSLHSCELSNPVKFRPRRLEEAFEQQVIEQEGGVGRRIAIVDHFKVDGHHGSATGHQEILRAPVAVDERLPAAAALCDQVVEERA
jgi:hypothetical protein